LRAGASRVPKAAHGPAIKRTKDLFIRRQYERSLYFFSTALLIVLSCPLPLVNSLNLQSGHVRIEQGAPEIGEQRLEPSPLEARQWHGRLVAEHGMVFPLETLLTASSRKKTMRFPQ